MYCAPILLRSAFSLIVSREIRQPSSVDRNNRLLVFTLSIRCSSLVIDGMHLVGLRAVRVIRSLSLFTLKMSCAPFIQRSAFRLIGNREICQQASVDQNIGL